MPLCSLPTQLRDSVAAHFSMSLHVLTALIANGEPTKQSKGIMWGNIETKKTTKTLPF